jgi:subtilisin-like proprotein convertase family protein
MKRVSILTALTVVGATGCATAVSGDDEGTPLPQSAVDQIEELLVEKAARTPAQRKISSQLLYAASGRFALPEESKGEDVITSLAQTDATGRVLVDVKGDGADLRARIEAIGGSVVDASAAHGSVRAWVALDRVEELAGDDAVRSIRPGLHAITHRHDAPAGGVKFQTGTRAQRIAAVQAIQESLVIQPPSSDFDADALGDTNAAPSVGSVASEGARAHAAERARKWFNVTGAGVTVGVLSDSDDLKEASIASGDLPASTITVPGQSGRPGSGEGTAMMEIIHDVAPGADLVFATAFTSAESFAENIRTLRFTYGCDIIVDDVQYLFESPYQDDIIAVAVSDVVADGALYFSSAGNGGNFDDGTAETWEGDFKSAGTLATLPSGYTVHDWGNKVISNRIEAEGGPLILHWSDPGSLDAPLASNDYDLFLLDHDLRNVVVAATDVQDGDDLPWEYLGYNIPPNYRIVIAAHPGAAKRAVRAELFGGELGLATAGSVYGHTASADAVSVAAVDAWEVGPAGEFVAGPTTPVELFSSDGSRRIFYHPDGTPITAGVLMASGGTTRKKPDLAGADGVLTTLPSSSGLSPFFGTSAAAPHVAGIAALMKSAVPGATTTKVRDSLRLGALDIEQTGVDRNAGSGIAQAMNALTRVGAVKAVFLEVAGFTATPTTSDVILPGGGGQLSIQLKNAGGAGATALSATLSSPSPWVTITSGSSTFPNVLSGGTTQNATPFAFTVASGAVCGEKLPFQLTINFTGVGTHPTVLDLLVPTGRPSAASTRFSYTGAAVAIPDNNPLGVDVPIAVSMTGPVSKVVFRADGSTCSATQGSTTVGIEHSWVGDTVIKLRSPSGRTVALANRPGGTLNGGNNFCQTVLDDAAAASIQDIASANAPWTGTFRPASPESAFVGEAATGTWTVNVADLFATDSGNVRAVSLDVYGFSCSP